MPAVMVAGALALAGCGGGSGTPAERDDGSCTFGKKMGSDDCYTEDEYRAKVKKEAEEAAEEERKNKEAADAARKRAKDLSDLFDDVDAAAPFATTNRPSQVGDARKASDGMASASEGKIQVGVKLVNGAPSDATAVLNAALVAGTGTIIGTGFATGSNQVVTHDGMTGTNKGSRSVRGTYNGAQGTFICVGECTSRRGSGNAILLDAGGGNDTWTFTPDGGQKFNAVAAAEYGWWINEPASSGAKIGAWHAGAAGGSAPTADISGSSGSATYKGDAIGQAAFYDSTTPGENVGGAFTADAELTATFGTAAMLEGEITNFEIGSTKPEWTVKLVKHDLTESDGTLDTTNTPRTEWTIGTGDDAVKGDPGGLWSANLHSIPTEGGHQPVGVIGSFHAVHGEEGSMIGAFGASQ